MKKDSLKIIIISFLAGTISGFFSSGGGMLLVPFFTHILKLDEVKARGTSVFCIVFFVVTSSIFYFGKKYVDYNLGLKCAMGGIIGAFIGSKLLMKIDKKYLKIFFIIFLLYSGIRIL
ncbi:MAG: sulfite exporter TauE/SafE family protein [Clostridia bacterium]|nr:sulfite exporter TauE/SafE family protein [Clostridia bacterium]